MNDHARIAPTDIWDHDGFTVGGFCAMADLGAFADMRAELVEGVIEKTAPAHGEHSQSNARILVRLANALRDDVAIGVDESWDGFLLGIAQGSPSLTPYPALDALIQQLEPLRIRA